jgi:hypothetical protein
MLRTLAGENPRNMLLNEATFARHWAILAASRTTVN